MTHFDENDFNYCQQKYLILHDKNVNFQRFSEIDVMQLKLIFIFTHKTFIRLLITAYSA